MKLVNQYIIPFKGLKEGKHDFDFTFDKEFFEENSNLEISDGNLTADLILEKKSTFLIVKTKLQGEIEIECDRCLERFFYPVNYSGELFVKFKEEVEEPDDKIIFLHPNEDLLDLYQYFYDIIGLSIPIQKIHPDNEEGESGCNKEMLDFLNSGAELDNSSEDIDPRWSKLKDLYNNENKNN